MNSADVNVDLRFAELQADLQPLKEQLESHPLYGELLSERNLRIFMSYHVYAVWDFMSVAKALQATLTCTQTPWFPVTTPEIRRFVNEMILEEESDVHPIDGYTSHFELYLSAMEQREVSTDCIRSLMDLARRGTPMSVALQEADVPSAARVFVSETWNVVEQANATAITAFFACGRETLLPGMFTGALHDIAPTSKPDLLEEYFIRHISLDGDNHGPMAMRMLEWQCGDDDEKWKIATATAHRALQARLDFWDGIVSAFGKPLDPSR